MLGFHHLVPTLAILICSVPLVAGLERFRLQYVQLPPHAHLLSLLRLLRLLPLTSLLRSLGSRLGIHDIVPKSEAARIVANEALMVRIVVIRAGPEGQEVVQAPRELVATVRIDSLEQTGDDPQVHGQDVQMSGYQDPQDGNANSARAEKHDFDRRRVLGGQTEGRRVGVVELVDVLVQRAPVQRAVEPVVPRILKDEEDADVEADGRPGRERNAGLHATVFRHGVEEPDLGQLDGEVGEEDEPRAGPLLCGGGDLLPLNLVLVEVGDPADYDPGDAAAEVDGLVHHKGHDSSREDIVLHVRVPALQGGLGEGSERARGGNLLPRGARRCSGGHCTWRARCRCPGRCRDWQRWWNWP